MSLLALHQSEGGGRQAGQQVSEIILCSHAGLAPDQNPAWSVAFFLWFCPFLLELLPFYKKIGADALVGFGGFSSFGPAMAARMRGMPVFIHEANRAVGKAVRFLAKRSTRVYLPEECNWRVFRPRLFIASAILFVRSFAGFRVNGLESNWGLPKETVSSLFSEAVRGAASLNRWVKQNIEELAKEGISTYCLTGMNKESSGVVQLDGPIGQTITSRFIPFTDEMNAVLSAADLVLSRAGAGAIAEIVRCRVPSILVPYPHAADNHQYLNASFLERKGGGIVCLEEKLDAILLDEIREVMFNEEFRAILRRNLFSMEGATWRASLPRTSFNRSRIALTVTPYPAESSEWSDERPQASAFVGCRRHGDGSSCPVSPRSGHSSRGL